MTPCREAEILGFPWENDRVQLAACAPAILTARGPMPKLTPLGKQKFGFPEENDRFQLAACALAILTARGPEPKLTPYREAENIDFP